MKKTDLSNSLAKLCLAMGLMLGPGAWAAYALPAPAEAQQVRNDAGASTLSGTVLDENGEPIISASVKVIGTNISVPTDIDGKFTLPSSLKPDQKVEISYVGYLPVTTTVGSLRNNAAVRLSPTAENLDELIVVGYGTQKKVNLTGAVQQVNAKELTARSVNSASVALQGLMGGVNVTQTSGAPGSVAGIQIRGVGSIRSDSNPLILIDGVEGDMNSMDINSIESISVLKDAASAAIYGSKSSNGVILVTTKRGTESRAQVSYNGWVGLRTPTEMPRPANAIEFMTLMDHAMQNVGSNPIYGDMIDTYRELGADNVYRYDTNWRDLIMKDNMLTTNHSISITGGSKSIRQYINGAYNYEDGIVPHNNFNRFTIRSNTDATLTSWLRASVNLGVRRYNGEQPAVGATSIIGYALTFSPVLGAVNADGTWADGQQGINPLAMAEVGGTSHSDSNDTDLKGTLIATPIDGLELQASYYTRRRESKSDVFTDTYDTYTAGNFVTTYPASGRLRSEGWSRSIYNQFNVQASYEKTVNEKHYFKVLAGFQTEETKDKSFNASAGGFSYDGYTQFVNSSRSGSIGGYWQELAMVSYYGRLNYIYDSKYMIELTGRYDGSSRFVKGNRWGFFPSFSAAWRISQENFFESAREYFSNLKLRASYGTLGNQNIGGYFPYASTLSPGGSYWAGEKYQTGIIPSQLANREISWEKSHQINVGLDFTTLNQRLDVTFDYYVRNIKSMLQVFPAPYYVGLAAPWQNAGDMRNNGWDLSITYRDRIGNVNFSATAILSDVKNKVTDLFGNKYINADNSTQVGHPIYSWYGYVADGYFQSQEEIDKYPVYGGDTNRKNIRPGFIRFKDIDDSGSIDDNDKTFIGDPQQRYLFSLNLTAQWNNFDFTAFFQGVGKRDIYASGYNVRPLSVGRSIMESQFDTWTEENRNAKYPLLVIEQTSGSNPNNLPSSFWIKSGAYMRLKNLVVGYTLPRNIISKVGLSNLRFYLSGQNIFTIQNAYPGYDPESTPGSYYPLMRIYTFGIDLRF